MVSVSINGEATPVEAPIPNHAQGVQTKPDTAAGTDNNKAYSLCTKCSRLRLEPDCFIVRSCDSGLPSPTSFKLRSTTLPSIFGTLKEISETSRSCNLCRLVFNSVKQEKGGSLSGTIEAGNELESATCTWNWEVDGRKIYESQDRYTGQTGDLQSPRGLTRRIHIRWSHVDLRDSYLVYAAPEALQTASDADKVWNPSRLFLGRQIGQSGNIQARVKSWIDLCQYGHRGPCSLQPCYLRERFCRMLSHAYFGVIDVLNMQLTQLSIGNPSDPAFSIPPYVALSYVWGDNPSYTTTLDNIMQHRQHGGLDRIFRDLPKVVQDSIDLVRRLGMQYLWVDALCIVQDSARSWSLNAYNMDLIYGCAAFTICAADGETASTGLLAMNENTGTGGKSQDIASCTPDVRLIVSRPPEMFIRSSKWNTRAWTFQERLLSRRCLIFTGSRVFFQCRSTGMAEDIFADREGAGWSLDFMDAPLQMFRQVSSRSIWVYMKSVELYTARELSKPGDILAAFSGVSNLLQRTMRAPFVFGLPSSHLDAAILWSYPRSVERRVLHTGSSKGEATEFPSWSWSGWLGGSVQYQRAMISDCTDNVYEWLNKRTWIRWYIRDDNGDLRPLWDPSQWSIDRSEHSKWRGYGHSRSSGSNRLRTNISARGIETRMSGATADSSSSLDGEEYLLPHPPPPPPPHTPIAPPSPPPGADDTWDLIQDSGYDDMDDSKERRRSSRSSAARSGTPPPRGRRNVSPSSSSVSLEDEREDERDEDQHQRRKSSWVPNGEEEPGSIEEMYRRPLSVDRHSTVKRSKSYASDINLHIIEKWYKHFYANEILRFVFDIILAMLRLLKHLLGFPTGSRPSRVVRTGLAIDLSDSESGHSSLEGQDGSYASREPQNKSRFSRESHHHRNSRPDERTRSSRMVTWSSQGEIRSRRRPRNAFGQDLDTSEDNGAEDASQSKPRKVRFDSHTYRPKSPATNPYAVGYNRDLMSPMPAQYSVMRGPPPVPTPPIQGASSSAYVSAAKRRQHDLIYQPDYKVEPEHTESYPEFRISLKDFPYQPAITSLGSGDMKATLLPILQFWTWHTDLFIQTDTLSTSGITRCNIADSFGDWCGSIMLDARWLSGASTAKQEFIALSEAKKFSQEECDTWSYYIPKEREESEWDLFYVLLIEWNDGKWERVGLGKVFKEAFREATWKEIVLA